jgi:hypothetical protein
LAEAQLAEADIEGEQATDGSIANHQAVSVSRCWGWVILLSAFEWAARSLVWFDERLQSL